MVSFIVVFVWGGDAWAEDGISFGHDSIFLDFCCFGGHGIARILLIAFDFVVFLVVALVCLGGDWSGEDGISFLLDFDLFDFSDFCRPSPALLSLWLAAILPSLIS